MKTKTSKHQIKTSFFELYHLRWHQIFQIIYFYEIFYMKVLKVSFLELDLTKLTRNSEKKRIFQRLISIALQVIEKYFFLMKKGQYCYSVNELKKDNASCYQLVNIHF